MKNTENKERDNNLDIQLFEAVSANNVDIVQELINAGAYVNAIDIDTGNTPLHIAAQNLNDALSYLLVRNGANVNAQNYHYYAPMDLIFKDSNDHQTISPDILTQEHEIILDMLLARGATITEFVSFYEELYNPPLISQSMADARIADKVLNQEVTTIDQPIEVWHLERIIFLLKNNQANHSFFINLVNNYEQLKTAVIKANVDGAYSESKEILIKEFLINIKEDINNSPFIKQISSAEDPTILTNEVSAVPNLAFLAARVWVEEFNKIGSEKLNLDLAAQVAMWEQEYGWLHQDGYEMEATGILGESDRID